MKMRSRTIHSLFAAVITALGAVVSVGASARELILQNGWTPYFGPSSKAEAFLDQGIVHFKGSITGGTSSIVTTLPVDMRPSVNVYVPVDLCNAAVGRLTILPTGVVFVQAAVSFLDAQCFTSLDGAKFVLSPGGFVPLGLQNGWIPAPFGAAAPAAAMVDGVVHLRGAMRSGGNANALVLPLGMIPQTEVYVSVTLTNSLKGRLRIQTSGNVSVQAENFADAQYFTSLDGVSFTPTTVGSTPLALANGWTHAPYSTSAAAATARDGIVFLKGAVALGSSTELFTLPASMRPATYVYVPIDLCSSKKGRLFIQPNGTVSVDGNFSSAQCFTSLDGASFVLPPPATFTPITPLRNGWIGASMGTATPAVVHYDGIVHLKGGLSNGTSATLFRLPVALRPERTVYIATTLNINNTAGRLVILPSGSVSVQSVGSFIDAKNFTSLEGVSFALNGANFSTLAMAPGYSAAPWGTAAPAAVMIDGIVHLMGGMQGVNLQSPTDSTPAFTLPVGMRPTTTSSNSPNIFPQYLVTLRVSLCNSATGMMGIRSDGSVHIFGDASAVNCFVSLDGVKFSPAANGFVNLAPSSASGWIDLRWSPNTAAGVVRNIVHLKGLLAQIPGNALILTLPASLRPAADIFIPIVNLGSILPSPGELWIRSNGEVYYNGVGSPAGVGTISMDGASYTLP